MNQIRKRETFLIFTRIDLKNYVTVKALRCALAKKNSILGIAILNVSIKFLFSLKKTRIKNLI